MSEVYDAGEVLQIGGTLAAVAIALATITLEKGPIVADVHVVPFSLLVAGIFLMGTNILAMDVLWRQSGLTYRSDLLALRPDDHPRLPFSSYLATVVLNWGLWLLAAAYYAMLFLLAR